MPSEDLDQVYGAHGWGLTVERRLEPTKAGKARAEGWGLHVPLRLKRKQRFRVSENALVRVVFGKQPARRR